MTTAYETITGVTKEGAKKRKNFFLPRRRAAVARKNM